MGPGRQPPSPMFHGNLWFAVIASGERPSRVRINAAHVAPFAQRPAKPRRRPTAVRHRLSRARAVRGLRHDHGPPRDVIYTPPDDRWHHCSVAGSLGEWIECARWASPSKGTDGWCGSLARNVWLPLRSATSSAVVGGTVNHRLSDRRPPSVCRRTAVGNEGPDAEVLGSPLL